MYSTTKFDDVFVLLIVFNAKTFLEKKLKVFYELSKKSHCFFRNDLFG